MFASVCLFKDYLPLKVGVFDEIAIDQKKPANARSRQRLGLHSAKRATSDDYGGRLSKANLTFFADLLEKNLS